MTGRSLSALGFLQIYCNKKSPTAEILRIYFLGTIVWRKYLPKIFAVGLFSCDKFEETPKQKVIDLSKLKEFYFKTQDFSYLCVLQEKKVFLRSRELISDAFGNKLQKDESNLPKIILCTRSKNMLMFYIP